MPSLRQSVHTRIRLSLSANWETRSSRSSGGNRPVTASTVQPGNFLRNSSATYSAVGIKRQKTMGEYPSPTSFFIWGIHCLSLASSSPIRFSAMLASLANVLRRSALAASNTALDSASLPSVSLAPGSSSDKELSSPLSRSKSALVPSASSCSVLCASLSRPLPRARVRRVAAAAAGLEDTARSRARADHHWMRCCQTVPSRRTDDRASARTLSKSSFHLGVARHVTSCAFRWGNGVALSIYARISPLRRCTKCVASLRLSSSCSLPERSSGSSLKSGFRKASRERKTSSLPLCGGAVTKIMCRLLSSASLRTSS